jgi:hypothetical protein
MTMKIQYWLNLLTDDLSNSKYEKYKRLVCGSLVYWVVSWIPVLGNLWEVPMEGSHITPPWRLMIRG